VLLVARFVVDDAQAFQEQAEAALSALAAQPGFRSARLTRALDDPGHWCLIAEWDSVGAYRRALSAFEVRVVAAPLLAEAIDEPSAYEALLAIQPGGPIVSSASDRADDPGSPLRSTT
jgi:heme oxygenase (mycobilin-producing)